ncbi:hypothetical protein NYE70_09555 [Paenibacillus sp. FSL R5-0407]|uniref:hypothetical protein n=1 Tax=Paenibacillus sp. FSL R5-0407 TaxID=2975320 RepID=UPI0030FBC628
MKKRKGEKMNGYTTRMNEIVRSVAEQAWREPLLTSGLWFHGDVRNNFYYASYLFAASTDPLYEEELPFDRQEAKRLAEHVLVRVLRLQQRDPDRPMYGHWPLNLDPVPEKAAPHELPVELMGSLMAYFHRKYERQMSGHLAGEFETALGHVYRGGFYRRPLTVCNHHEAKYTAAKLIFGQLYGDEELLEDGKNCLASTLERLRKEGMAEYGCLPWFWHWIQAFTCALEFATDPQVKRDLGELLDELWTLRASYYLKGAWVGAHSRGWPHDAPSDANVLHDYVQFGDFELPADMPRTEYAGFLFREAPERARSLALNRTEPAEVSRALWKVTDEGFRQLHSYAYVTKHYAAGGLWERVREFDNEQVRWMFSLPVRRDGQGNQLYFFHPGEGYDPSGRNPRHQSPWMEVLYRKNVVISLYPLPAEAIEQDAPEGNEVVGVLPEGEWIYEAEALFGKVDEVLFAVYLNGSYEIRPMSGYNLAVCRGSRIGVVVEAVSLEDVKTKGINSLTDFAALMAGRTPVFADEGGLTVEYTGLLHEENLRLAKLAEGKAESSVNGTEITFQQYTV